MNRIKVDFPSLSPNLGNCPYVYSFRSIYGLEHGVQVPISSIHQYLEDDIRSIILEQTVKDFTIEVRKSLYGDDFETMVMSDLTGLIKPEPFEKGQPRIKNLKTHSLFDLVISKLKFW